MATRCMNPAPLAALFGVDPDVHLYGLPDLEEPFWSLSTWWLDGDAAVGFVQFPGDGGVTAYAMSQRSGPQTLEVLAGRVHELPKGTLVTGPSGLGERIRRERDISDLGVHWRLIHDRRPVAVASEVVQLGEHDLEALGELYDSDSGAAFFLPHMLHTGVFVGVRDGQRLLAAAGTHVASERYGVAAIGAVLTHPDHRGRGLGRLVTESLTALLMARFGTIGLNVAESNLGALRLYEGLGFVRRFAYEEIELR